MFNIKFEIVENRSTGAQIVHYLKGRKDEVKKDVEEFKRNSKAFIVNGRRKMTIWS